MTGDGDHDKWTFVGRDPYTYPVFHAGARICLGKEIASLLMKRVVAAVLRRFKDVLRTKVAFRNKLIGDHIYAVISEILFSCSGSGSVGIITYEKRY